MSEQFSFKLLLSYITNHCNNCNKIHEECELNTILQLYSTKLVSFYTYQGYAEVLELAIADNVLSENILNDIREFSIANL